MEDAAQASTITMNGHAVRSSSSASNYDSRYGTGLHPSSKALLESYNGSLESTDEDREDRQRFQHVGDAEDGGDGQKADSL